MYSFIKISLKRLSIGRANNNPALVQTTAWCQTGGKLLSKPMMALFNDAYTRHSTSMSQPFNQTIRFICMREPLMCKIVPAGDLAPKMLGE